MSFPATVRRPWGPAKYVGLLHVPRVCVQVQEHLDKFIAAMQQLFERYKAQAGYPERQLVVL